MEAGYPTNEEIANVLKKIADLLETKKADPHRIWAYRNGASTVRASGKSLGAIVAEEGAHALKLLPNIGEGLSSLIDEYVRTGRSTLLDELQGEVSAEDLFAQVPGVGPELADRIAAQLQIDTLEELEMAAHDGRLAKVEGFGPKRLRTVRTSLAGILSRAAQRRRRFVATGEGPSETNKENQPDVGLLLEVDAEYRRKAKAGQLRTIAPRRFNPTGEAWLPIMHTSRSGWSFTVLYSNSARAHKLGTTDDWVVIYYEQDEIKDQATVVTAKRGPLQDRRVVRGRELECRRYYS